MSSYKNKNSKPIEAEPVEAKAIETPVPTKVNAYEVAASSISVGGVLPPTNKGTVLKPAQVKALEKMPGKEKGSTLFSDLLEAKSIIISAAKKTDTPES